MDNSMLNNVSSSSQNSEKISNAKQQFNSVLEDFKKYYVFYNKNPEVSEYHNFFMNSKAQLQKLNKDILTMSKDLQKNIQTMDKTTGTLNQKLSNEKKLNEELMKLMNNLTNKENGSGIMIDDSKFIYNEQYYKNVSFFISLILAGGLIGVLIK